METVNGNTNNNNEVNWRFPDEQQYEKNMEGKSILYVIINFKENRENFHASLN